MRWTSALPSSSSSLRQLPRGANYQTIEGAYTCRPARPPGSRPGPPDDERGNKLGDDPNGNGPSAAERPGRSSTMNGIGPVRALRAVGRVRQAGRPGTATRPDAPLRRVDPDVASSIAQWFI